MRGNERETCPRILFVFRSVTRTTAPTPAGGTESEPRFLGTKANSEEYSGINHEIHKTRSHHDNTTPNHQTNAAMPRPNNNNTNHRSSSKDLAVYGNLFSCKYHGGTKSKRVKEQKRLDAYGNLFSVANRN